MNDIKEECLYLAKIREYPNIKKNLRLVIVNCMNAIKCDKCLALNLARKYNKAHGKITKIIQNYYPIFQLLIKLLVIFKSI